MVEDLRRFLYFHFFLQVASALPWSKKSGIWKAYWLDLVGIYHYAKDYQKLLNVLSAIAIFMN